MTDHRQVDARIERADVHIQTLRDEVNAYVDGPPYSIEKSTDRATMTRIERAVMRIDPPLSIAIVFSDAAHQLRSALDNLVGALRVGGPSHMSQFPVKEVERDFPTFDTGVLQGVPEWAWQAVREVQPFAVSRPFPDHLRRGLMTLHDLARMDRHRAPHLHAALLFPGPAIVGEGVEVDFKVDDARTVASIEYPYGEAVDAMFEVDVLVQGTGLDGADGHDVVGLAQFLQRTVTSVIEYVRRAEHLQR